LLVIYPTDSDVMSWCKGCQKSSGGCREEEAWSLVGEGQWYGCLQWFNAIGSLTGRTPGPLNPFQILWARQLNDLLLNMGRNYG